MAKNGTAAEGVMDVITTLQEVLKTTLIHNGQAWEIPEGAEALDKCQAHLCVLASNCDEPAYVKCWWRTFVLNIQSTQLRLMTPKN